MSYPVAYSKIHFKVAGHNTSIYRFATDNEFDCHSVYSTVRTKVYRLPLSNVLKRVMSIYPKMGVNTMIGHQFCLMIPFSALTLLFLSIVKESRQEIAS
jgi:hypothetical protein